MGLLVLVWRVVPASCPRRQFGWGDPLRSPLAGRGDERLLWLSTIVPSIFADRPGAVTDGDGVATNPVFVQDLAIWLPAAAVVALGLWRRRPWGALLAGAVACLLVHRIGRYRG